MESFKSNRGSFFGIIVPGAFLFINFYFINSEFLNAFVENSLGDARGETNAEIFLLATLFFVISYVLGMTLRLLKPSAIEFVAIPPRIIAAFFDNISRILLGKKANPMRKRIYVMLQSYPYSHWFINTYIKYAGTSYRKFYEDILEKEYEGKIELLDLSFINHCKVYVLEHSEKLADEVLYNEGISRFISGVIYSLLIILISMTLNFQEVYRPLFWIYFFILILYLLRFRRLRVKEALTILDGYVFLKNKKEND